MAALTLPSIEQNDGQVADINKIGKTERNALGGHQETLRLKGFHEKDETLWSWEWNTHGFQMCDDCPKYESPSQGRNTRQHKASFSKTKSCSMLPVLEAQFTWRLSYIEYTQNI